MPPSSTSSRVLCPTSLMKNRSPPPLGSNAIRNGLRRPHANSSWQLVVGVDGRLPRVAQGSVPAPDSGLPGAGWPSSVMRRILPFSSDRSRAALMPPSAAGRSRRRRSRRTGCRRTRCRGRHRCGCRPTDEMLSTSTVSLAGSITPCHREPAHSVDAAAGRSRGVAGVVHVHAAVGEEAGIVGEPEQPTLATGTDVGERQHGRHRLAREPGPHAATLLEHHDPTVGERLHRGRLRERGDEAVGEAGGHRGRRHGRRRTTEGDGDRYQGRDDGEDRDSAHASTVTRHRFATRWFGPVHTAFTSEQRPRNGPLATFPRPHPANTSRPASQHPVGCIVYREDQFRALPS